MKKRIILFIFLLSISTIILGIGYAAVNNITLELDGNTNVKKSDYIKITKVEYQDNVLANVESSTINSFYATTINSKIVLGNDINSSISYEVTLKNDTDKSFKYIDTVHDNSSKFYDNENIGYEVSGIESGETILPDSEKVITLTFKYKSLPIENTMLNSYINIKFIQLYDIEYVNIDSNNLINKIGENESANIEFPNPPVNIDVSGDLDYEYNNGILSISNVNSDIVITGKEGSQLYSLNGEKIVIGSTINPNDYPNRLEDINGTYIKYTVDSNNKIFKVEGCKTKTLNADKICITALDPNEYSNNKEIMASYFGGSVNNLPNNCNETDKSGNIELTCSNAYILLTADNEGAITINDLENNKSCIINPKKEMYSCK